LDLRGDQKETRRGRHLYSLFQALIATVSVMISATHVKTYMLASWSVEEQKRKHLEGSHLQKNLFQIVFIVIHIGQMEIGVINI